MERCVQHKAQAVKMPKHDERMYFNMQEKQLPLPFMFVADFETILKPLDTVLPEVPEPDVPIRDSDGQFRFSKLRNVGLPEHGLRSTSSTTRIHEHHAPTSRLCVLGLVAATTRMNELLRALLRALRRP